MPFHHHHHYQRLSSLLLFFYLSTILISFCLSNEDHDTSPHPNANPGSYHDIANKLRHIQKIINNNQSHINEQYDGIDQMVTGPALFHRNVFQMNSNGLPIIYWRIDLSTEAIGNNFGTYFDAIGCAELAGLHFVGVLGHPLRLGNGEGNEPFFNAVPFIIPHPNPVKDHATALTNIEKKCTCNRYCSREGQPWEAIIPQIRHIFAKGMYLHLSTRRHGLLPEERGMLLNPGVDIYSVNSHQFLPLIPDVAIHYRCSDNTFGGMGLLSFKTVIDRIPPEAKYIYIFTEAIERVKNELMEPHAETILKTLKKDIETAIKGAVVVVKRGSHLFTTFSQFGFANVTICSPSTFCLYPAMARTKTTYFPIGSGVYINTFKDIHPTFHFLRFEESEHNNNQLFYNQFTSTWTTEAIIKVLRTGLPF